MVYFNSNQSYNKDIDQKGISDRKNEVNEKIKKIFNTAVELIRSPVSEKLQPKLIKIANDLQLELGNPSQDLHVKLDTVQVTLNNLKNNPDNGSALDALSQQKQDLYDLWVCYAELKNKSQAKNNEKVIEVVNEGNYDFLLSLQENLRIVKQALIYDELDRFKYLELKDRDLAVIYLSQFSEEERRKIFSMAGNDWISTDFVTLLDEVSRNRSILFSELPNEEPELKRFENFFHLLHGDSFILNTNYAGGSDDEHVNQLKNFINKKPEYKKQLEYLDRVVDLKNDSDLENKLQRLPNHLPLLVLTGWKGNPACPGHSISIEFTKMDSHQFNMKIINSGLGLHEYHPKLTYLNGTLEKILFSPLVYENVPAEYLVLQGRRTSPVLDVLRNLLQSEEHLPENVFYSLFAHLEPFKVKNEDLTVFYTPQRSGTCSIKCVMLALRGQFDNIDDYKRFKLDLKYYSLCVFYNKFLKSAQVLECRKQFFNDCCEKFIRSLTKSTEQGIISEAKAIEFSESISKWLLLTYHTQVKAQEPVADFTISAKEISLRSGSQIVQLSQASQTIEVPRAVFFAESTSITESFIDDRLEVIGQNFKNYPNLAICQFEDLTEIIFVNLELLKKNILADIDKFEINTATKDTEFLTKTLGKYHGLHVKYYDQIQSQGRCNANFDKTNHLLFCIFHVFSEIHNPDVKHFKPFISGRQNNSYTKEGVENIHKFDHFLAYLNSSVREEIFSFGCLAKTCEMYGVSNHQGLLGEISFLKKIKKNEKIEEELIKAEIFIKKRYFSRSKRLTKDDITAIALMLHEKDILIASGLHFYASAIFAMQRRDSILLEEGGNAMVELQFNDGTMMHRFPSSSKGLAEFSQYNEYQPAQELSLRLLANNGSITCFDSRGLSINGYKENDLISLKAVRASDKAVTNYVEKSLACVKNLFDFSGDRFNQLSENASRQECFQSFFILNKENRPLIEDELKREVFRKDFYAWISRGINYYTNSSSGKPEVAVVVFFLDLMDRSSEFLNGDEFNDVPKIDSTVVLRSLLSAPNLTREERILLHTMNILLTCKKSKYEPQDLSPVVWSWIFINSVTDINKGFNDNNKYMLKDIDLTSFIYKEEMIREYQKILPILSVVDMQLCLENYHPLDLDPNQVIIWDVSSFPTITSNCGMTVDLASGKVYFNGSLFQKEVYKSYAENKKFEQVFEFYGGGQERKVESFPDYDRFEEAGLPFRLIKEDWGLGFTMSYLQVLIHGTWYQYLSKKGAEFLPAALLIDHHVFESEKGVILLKRDGLNLAYQANHENQLINCSTERKCLACVDTSPFTSVECTAWMLLEEDDEGRQYVSLPRLQTSLDSTQCLSFYQQEKGGPFYYSKDPNFFVDTHIPSLVIPSDNFLRLSNANGETKILIPILALQSSEEYVSPNKLDIKIEQGKFSNSNLRKDFHPTLCAEYRLTSDSLQPITTESRLHLAYLYLGGRHYVKASEIIDKMQKEKLSQESCDIILRIINAPITTSSSTVSSVAIALQTYYLFSDQLNSLNKSDNQLLEKMEDMDSTIGSLVFRYRNEYNNIQAGLHLDRRALNFFKIEERAKGYSTVVQPLLDSYLFLKPNQNAEQSTYNQIVGEQDSPKKIEIYLNSLSVFTSNHTTQRHNLIAALWPKIKESFRGVVLPLELTDENFKEAPFDDQSIDRLTGLLAARKEGNSSSMELDKNTLEEEGVVPEAKGRSGVADVLKYMKNIRGENTIQGDFPSFNEEVSSIDRYGIIQEERMQKAENVLSFEPIVKNKLYNDEFKKINDSIKEASKETKTKYTLLAGAKINLLQQERTIKNRIENLEYEILTLSNKRADNSLLAMLTDQLITSKTVLSPAIPMLVTAFLDGKKEGYVKINPDLSEEDIICLDGKIMEYLCKSCDLKQIQRTLAHQDEELAAQEIADPVCYGCEDDFFRLFLVFEYRADLRMRQTQVDLLKAMLEKGEDGRYKNMVAQMIMGGGKTSVLTSILIHKACQNERIPILIGLMAQYETLVKDLGARQQQNFYSKITPIQVTREVLTVEKLTHIKKSLYNAKNHKEAILTTPESIHIMALELEELRLSDSPNKHKFSLLRTIMSELKNHGDLLIDEVDKVLTANNEMIFPQGPKIPISSITIMMVREVIEYHLKDGDLIGLLQNKQGSYGRKDYINEVLPIVSEMFFKNHPDLLPYKKLIMGENKTDRVKVGCGFFGFSKKRTTTAELQEKIDIAKEIFTFLPITLQKFALQRYDRLPGEEKVIPYIAAGHPSRKEFGSNVEAALYHFQTILAKKAELPCLISIAYRLKERALHAVSLGAQLEETPEYISFKDITGTHLLEFCNQENIRQKAISHINQEPKRLLDLEEHSIAYSVGRCEKYLSSNSQCLVNMFNTVRAFSGTPWNQVSYDDSLQSEALLDPKTVGQILISCVEKGSRVYCGCEENIQSILATLSEQATGYIDACGMLKEYSNEEVARGIIAERKNIQSVLYFNNEDKLCALQRQPHADPVRVVIGSSTKDAFKNRGIDLEKCFVYYDEAHCEATDIPQKETAINGLGFSHKTSLRTLVQSMLRLRKFFKDQNIELLISTAEGKHFSGSVDVKEIITKAIHNQIDEICEEFTRSVEQKLLAKIKKYLYHKNSFILAHLRGLIEFDTEQRNQPVSKFLEHLDTKVSSWPVGLRQELETSISELIQSPYYQKSKMGSGLEVTIQTQTQTQKEISQELVQELELYQGNSGSPYQENVFTQLDKGYFNVSSSMQYFKKSSKNMYKLDAIVPVEFRSLFPSSIHISLTANYAFCTEQISSMLDNLQKPIKQVLLIKRGKSYQFVILSCQEGAKAKELLEQDQLQSRQSLNDFHLILPDGTPYVGSGIPHDETIKEGLWHLNFLAGNLTYLMNDFQRSARIFKEPNSILRKRYLKLKNNLKKNDLIDAFFMKITSPGKQFVSRL